MARRSECKPPRVIDNSHFHKRRSTFCVVIYIVVMSAIQLFNDLESNDSKIVDEVKSRLKEQFNGAKESWLLNLIYDYYLATDSLRAVDVIVAIKEPHDKFFFDKSFEGVKGSNKLPHLTLLGYIVRKRPIWLFGISSHPLFKELLRLLKTETDIVTLVSALLIINILLPVIPALLVPHLQEMFAAFSKLAAVNANSNNYHDAQLVHLQISLYTLFHRLYGMFPCNFLSYLRKTYSPSQTSFPVFSHTVKPMLDTVRVNPLLISATDSWEILPDRWKNVEPHDIIISCAKLLMNGNPPTEPNTSFHETKSAFSFKDILGGLKVSGKTSVVDYCNELSKKTGDATLWSPSARHFNSTLPIESTPTRIPLTPITRAFEVSSPYSDHEGSSPPEAAIEATPETTPIRDFVDVPHQGSLSIVKNYPQKSSKVPITDRSFPSSPVKKESFPFRYSAPEIVPDLQTFASSSSLRKINQIINDRNKVISDESVIELKPVRACRNDLGNYRSENHQKMISSEDTLSSSFLDDPNFEPLVDSKQTNGSSACVDQITGEDAGLYSDELPHDNEVDHDENRTHADLVEELENCVNENSGSPCSSGGLHMPDNRTWHLFVKDMRRMRHHSQCQSESGNFSTGTSPQDIPSYLNEAKVRRTNSCPEIKKNSPGTTFAATMLSRPSKQPLPEENDEDNDENLVPANKGETNGNDFFTKTAANSGKTCEKICSSSQTEDIQPFHFPYEHLFLDVFPPLHPTHSADHISPTESENSLEEKTPSIYERVCSPSKILQKYIDAAIQCHTDKSTKSVCPPYDAKFLANQLKLMSIQLQFEEHRREIHAERNRRLLGRSRRNKTLEEYNNALKDQVLLLQQDLENSRSDISKLVQQKEKQINHEQKAAEYWQQKFVELQKEHKSISDKCQEIEVQLRDERKINAYSTKLINESKANLIDVTNELKTCQKEAKTARELRSSVARFQAEILKAGEMIIRLRRRLADFAGITPAGTQEELTNAACAEELKKLKSLLDMQSMSLDATKDLIAHLRSELKNKENVLEEFKSATSAAGAKQENELKELKQKYGELKKSYLNAVEDSKKLEYQLDRAKVVNKFVLPSENKSAIENEIRRSTRRAPIVDRESNSNRSEGNSVDGDKRRVDERASYFHSSGGSNAGNIENTSKDLESSSAATERTKMKRQQKNVKNSSTSCLDTSHNLGIMIDDVASPSLDLAGSTLKKKGGRMECAESGQLKSTSTLSDHENASSSSSTKRLSQ